MEETLQKDILFDVDISEDELLKAYPDAFNLLLKDHTMSTPDCQHNIFWATSDYEELGNGYGYSSQILPELITGEVGKVVMPRVLKASETQRERSKDKAEVFTPSWICNAQNNLIDNVWFDREDVFNHENEDHTWTTNPDKITFPKGKTWRDYVRDTRLEITCGEAPYIVSRYDTTTGQLIPIADRIGILDRKLRVVSENTEDSGEWLKWAQIAYQNTYGYEWQGDSLLLARESLLATFIEYYYVKFGQEPLSKSILYIAYIISWNLWQMDGLKGVVPNSCGTKSVGTSLFGDQEYEECKGCLTEDIKQHNGDYCYIMDWAAKPKRGRIRFIDLIKQ